MSSELQVSLQPLVDSDDSPVSGRDVDHVFGAVDAAGDDGQDPAAASEPADEAADEPGQTACPVPQHRLHLRVRT